MSKLRVLAITGCCAAVAIAATVAQAAPGDTLGISTLIQRIVPTGSGDFKTLTTSAGETYTVRDGSESGRALGTANSGRETKRTALSYFGQLTDFQLADEESPARVEFLDPQGGPFTAAWRPSEALNPHEENAMIEQMNAFAENPPNTAGDGSRRKMDFVMNTGDIADSQQYNEVLWNRQLIEGGTVNPNSGVNPAPYIGNHPLCPAGLTINDAADPGRYTGVQDSDDWPGGQQGYFYDPDDPTGYPAAPDSVVPYAGAHTYPGLMDQAQKPFQATGLKVPGYVLFGNHDSLVQGNAYATKTFNQLATGCLKPINDAEENSGLSNSPLFGFVVNPFLTADDVLSLYETNSDYFMAVPPDPNRRLIPKKEYMEVFKAGNDPDGHGFGFIDPAEATASRGSAGYYSFSPSKGVRFITLDTTSEGGRILASDRGNLDNPQFNWFESELKKATATNEVVIVFSHHAVSSMTADVRDEEAPSCQTVDPTEVIGCDADPRNSSPIRLAADVTALMHKYPHAIAWVAGHSHENKVDSYRNPDGESGFWSIRTAALVDWPKQNRLLELFDNRDGNLSIFGTLIDHTAPVPAPPDGTAASTMSTAQLASTARTIGYNDNQNGGEHCAPDPCGEGTVADRNVELLIKDPRRPEPAGRASISKVRVAPKAKRLRAGKRTRLAVRVTNRGTKAAVNVRVQLRSSNRRVRVPKRIVIKRIAPGKTAQARFVVRANRKAKGRARIVARVGNRKGAATIRVIRRR